MNQPSTSNEFPLPSTLRALPGTESAQAAHPYNIQFTETDDSRFWFYNSMHFPEPMSAFDMVTAEAAYCALGSANTRVHCLPTTLGIDYRIINGRVYIGGNAVTDPGEIARRQRESGQHEEPTDRAFAASEDWGHFEFKSQGFTLTCACSRSSVMTVAAALDASEQTERLR
jgi:pyruvate, water dikinase